MNYLNEDTSQIVVINGRNSVIVSVYKSSDATLIAITNNKKK